jgi:hypothetical protein
LGIVGIYISLYDSKKDSYVQNGNLLIDLFNELKTLYRKVKSSTNPTNEHLEQLSLIEQRYTKISNSHQILFSNWCAHYKFFWEHQIDWIDEQLNFKFFRDKIPLVINHIRDRCNVRFWSVVFKHCVSNLSLKVMVIKVTFIFARDGS